MKLTGKEKEALSLLRALDAQQRDRLLAQIQRAVLSNTITKKAGGLKKVQPVADHKIVKAFGKAPPWRPKKEPR